MTEWGTTLDSLLGALYSPLSQDQQLLSAVNVTYDGNHCYVQVQNDTFRTSIDGGSGDDLVADLRSQSLSAFLAWLNEQQGYSAYQNPIFVNFLAEAGLAIDRFGAWCLAETVQDVVTENQVLGISQNTLLQLLHPAAASLRDVATEIIQIAGQASADQASGVWLDSFGTLYGVPRNRLPGGVNEADTAYRTRIIESIIAPRANGYAIQEILRTLLGVYDVQVQDDLTPATEADLAAKIAGHPWNRMNPWHFFLTVLLAPGGGFNQSFATMAVLVDQLKPWGTSFTPLLEGETSEAYTGTATDEEFERSDTLGTIEQYYTARVGEQIAGALRISTFESWPCENPWLLTARAVALGEHRLLLTNPSQSSAGTFIGGGSTAQFAAAILGTEESFVWIDFILPWASTDSGMRTSGQEGVFAIGNSGNTEYVAAYLHWSGSAWSLIFETLDSGNAGTVTIALGSWPINTRFVVCAQWTGTTLAVSLNGATSVTGVTTSTPPLSALPDHGYFGSWADGSTQLGGTLRQVVVGQGVLPDAFLADLYAQVDPVAAYQFTSELTQAYAASLLWNAMLESDHAQSIPLVLGDLFLTDAFVYGYGLLTAINSHEQAPSDLATLAQGTFVAAVTPTFDSTDSLLLTTEPTIFALRSADETVFVHAYLTTDGHGGAAVALTRTTAAGSVTATHTIPAFTSGTTIELAGVWSPTALFTSAEGSSLAETADSVFDPSASEPDLILDIGGFGSDGTALLPVTWLALGEGSSLSSDDETEIVDWIGAPLPFQVAALSNRGRWLLWNGINQDYAIVDPILPLNNENLWNDGNANRTTAHTVEEDGNPLALTIGPTRCIGKYIVNHIEDSYSDTASAYWGVDAYGGANDDTLPNGVLMTTSERARRASEQLAEDRDYITTELVTSHLHQFRTNNIFSRTQQVLAKVSAAPDFEPDDVTPLSLVHGIADTYRDFKDGVPMLP